MIDIHCHILPGMDDGAADTAEAGEMLAMAQASGVDRLFLTPHFYPEQESEGDFLRRRAEALTRIGKYENVQLRLGAEVRYCRDLLSLDLRRLTLGESDYLLLELPGHRYPAYAVRIVEELLGNGLIPVLAHVERYAYFREDPALLKRLIDLGALAQVSALALTDRRDKKFAAACLQHYLAQTVASDAHNTTTRKPCMEMLKKLPQELQQLHNAFSEAMWANELPVYIRASHVKKTFFGYR